MFPRFATQSSSYRRSTPASIFFACVGVLALTGCQTYTAKTEMRDSALRSGSIDRAVLLANADAEKHRDDRDAVLYRLEQGSILRQAALAKIPAPADATTSASLTATTTPQTATNSQEPPADTAAMENDLIYLRRSLAAFDRAEEKVNVFEEQAKVRLGSSATALLTNQGNVPYQGRAYDRVMMNAYKALNYMQLGDRDAARVELNRALQRQRDAVAENAKRLEQATEEAQRAKQGQTGEGNGTSYDVESAKTDSRSGPAFAEIEAELDARIKPYGDYVNPFVVFLDGLFFITHAENASDLERARKSFERVAGMVPENKYAKEDWQMSEAAANGRLPSGLTYVIFETGSAPYRESNRIDLPIFAFTNKVSYVGAAFPRLRFPSSYAPTLSVTVGANRLDTATVSSMDSVVARDFKNEWPAVVTRTILSTVSKAAVDGVVQKQAADKWGAAGQLLAKAATVAMGAGLNVADTRTWRSLPKEFQYLRVATPEDRTLTLSAGGQTQTVTLLPGAINVVYVKTNDSSSPLLVNQFVLKP